jgi:hypothetical protein
MFDPRCGLGEQVCGTSVRRGPKNLRQPSHCQVVRKENRTGSGAVCGLYDACIDARRSNDEDGQVIKPGPLSQKEIVDRFEAMFGPAQRRAAAVASQLIGLSGKEARELAARSRCIIRAVRIDGRSLVVTADYAPHRIDVATEDGIIVDVLSPRGPTEKPQD